MRVSLAISLLLIAGLVGCRSHVIQMEVVNQSGGVIRNLEVRYPGGSYGLAAMSPGQRHVYRIKSFHPAAIQLDYIDSSGHPHNEVGPRLAKDDEGSIVVSISGGNVTWDAHLQQR